MRRHHNLTAGAPISGPLSRGRIGRRHGLAPGGGGSPSLIAGSHAAGGFFLGGAGTTTAISGYTVPAGSDKILIVMIAGRRANNQDPYPVSGITFGGNAMTEVTGARAGDRGLNGPSILQWFIYYLGDTTPTGDIAVTQTMYYHFEVDAIVIEGAAQSAQPAAANSTGTTDATSTALTGLSGSHFIVDGVIVAEEADNLTPVETVISERSRPEGGANYPAFRTGIQYAVAVGDKTMTWTYSGSVDRYHGAMAFAPV